MSACGGAEARSSSPPHEFGSSGPAVIEYDGKIVAIWRGPGRVFETARYRRNGRLDSRFGTGGKVVDFNSRYGSGADAVAVQPNHKIVAFGGRQRARGDPAECYEGGQFAIARYLPNGQLDRRFGRAGRVLTRFGEDTDGLIAGAVQPGGKIVAVGARWCQVSSILQLARYTRDGRLDRTFGKGGKVVNGRFSPAAVAAESDGTIVLAGFSLPDTPEYGQATLVRYLPNGRLDRSFGIRGTVVTRFENGGGFGDVAVQPEGKILAVGVGGSAGYPHFALARYEPDGSPDPTFGDGGKIVTPLTHGEGARAVAIQGDGKIVVGGGAENGMLVLARYAPDGHLDPTFGHGGKVVNKRRGDVSGIAIQPNRRIVVLARPSRGWTNALVLLRFMPDGSPDPSFGK